MYDKEMIAQGHAKSHETDKQADWDKTNFISLQDAT